MSYSVIVSYNSANEERAIAKNLIDYLSTKGVPAAWGDPDRSETNMKQGLSTARWLVMILTPETVRSPHVQSLVETAFEYVSQGRMQGILALAFLTNPVDLEDLPSPLWSTIRIYYTGEKSVDHQQAFEKLSRTLSTTKVPVRTVPSPAANWASPFSSAGSRPLPPILQPALRPRTSLRNRLFIGLALFAILVVLGSIILVFGRLSAENLSRAKATAAAQTRANFAATAKANAASTAQAQATATAISQLMNLGSSQLYTQVTKQPPSPTNPMKSMHDNNACKFTGTMFHVISSVGSSVFCMARKTNFENFAYQAQMTLISGDIGGLIFRSDDGSTTFYRFSLDSTGQYTLDCQQCSSSQKDNDGPQTLQQGPVSGIQTTIGKPELLTVIAINQDIYLYVNGNPVNQKINNATIPGPGEIGVFATSATKLVDVAFSSVEVWKLP